MMKLSKKICAFSVAAVMSLSVCAPAFAEEAENKVDVQFNGATTEDAAVLTEGTTYLKAADVKALFGVDCTVTDGKAVLTVDGQAVNVDAQVAEGDLIPVRAIATALGCSLGWDDAAKTVVVIDVDKMAADNGATFEIIGKYMDYALSLGDNYKTTSEFSGNVEVVDDTATISLPFSGTTEGITSAKGEEMTMKLALDFKQITEMLEAQGIADSEKETLDAIIKALENSETKYIYDMEKNIFYMNSTMFTALGLSADTWVSLDLGVLFEMSGATGLDLTSILDLAMSGDIQAYIENMDCIERMPQPYVVIAPSYMIYTADYSDFIQAHIDSGADISMMYHSVDNAKDAFLACDTLNINKQKGVLSIEPNRGNAKNRNIFMDTYVMTKELFLELVNKAHKTSSMYTFADIIDEECEELDIRAVPHRGYFAAITDFKSYYDANMALIDLKNAMNLFDDEWPVYTRTNDSCPTQYFADSKVTSSVVSNGCLIDGEIENSIIGRGCVIKPGAVVKNCVISADVVIGKGVHIENMMVDKHARLIRGKRIIASPEKPGYVKRGDTL